MSKIDPRDPENATQILEYFGETDDLINAHDYLAQRASGVSETAAGNVIYQFPDGRISLGNHTTYHGNATPICDKCGRGHRGICACDKTP